MNQDTATQTVQRLLTLKRALGISRIANLSHLDHFNVKVVSCIRPMAKHLSLSQGKGFNLNQATISAIMEAVEIYHVENPPPALFTNSYQALITQKNLLSPNYATRTCFDQIDLEQQPMAWIAGTCLISNRETFVPRQLCTMDSSTPQPLSSFIITSTNGLASGLTLDHAICHSLSEIIERHSLKHWQHRSAKDKAATQVDLNTIAHPNIKQLIKTAKERQIQIAIWDITGTTKLPSYHCALLDASLGGLGISTGTGAHCSPAIALEKAVTEAAQARLTLITGNRDDLFEHHYQQQLPAQYEKRNGELDCQRRAALLEGASDLGTINRMLLQQLSSNHSTIVMVDLTNPTLNIPTVQIHIPGMMFDLDKGRA